MKQYTDEGVIPQALFQHKVAGIMCGLIDNVTMIKEDIAMTPWSCHELSDGYTVIDAVINMETELRALRKIHREFIEYLNNRDEA